GAVRHAGIVVSDAAQRLSLLIPLAAAFLLFGETASATKLAGMAVALTALACLLWQSGGTNAAMQDGMNVAAQSVGGRSGSGSGTLALLLWVWVGYGAIDILFKQMARSAVDFSSSLLASFVLAGLLMGAWLLWRRTRWRLRSVAAGMLLGALNFSNIYF